MQSTNQPAKFLIPFAQNDSARVEIPATTSDPTRFSQEKGSPPLTGMPPEAGGVPPQLEDFNGALNQIARGVWWALGGGRFAYDSAWATDSLIGGYARGAVLPAALGTGTVGMGEWYNNAEANTADPDATGTGWVPGYHYGVTALASQTGGTVTLTPAQAAKRVITVAGTLTSNLVLVVPAWIYSWRITNNTGGAFTVTVKNAATSGVDIPQNGAATAVNCDGTQVSLDSPNIAPAVFGSQPMQYGQAVGRLLNVQRFTASGTYTPTPGTAKVVVEMIGGGGGGGGSTPGSSGFNAIGGGGGAGAMAKFMLTTVPATVAVTVGAGGAGGAGVAGSAGSASVFGSYATTPAGTGGTTNAQIGTSVYFAPGAGGGGTPTLTGVTVLASSTGGGGNYGLATGNLAVIGGKGASSAFGSAGGLASPTAPPNTGAGGEGAASTVGEPPKNGGGGGSGVVIVWEYS